MVKVVDRSLEELYREEFRRDVVSIAELVFEGYDEVEIDSYSTSPPIIPIFEHPERDNRYLICLVSLTDNKVNLRLSEYFDKVKEFCERYENLIGEEVILRKDYFE